MKSVNIDKDGNVIDQNGNVIGKKVGNTIMPLPTKQQEKQPENKSLSFQERMQGCIVQQQNSEPNIDINNQEIKKAPNPSSYSTQITKYEVTKDTQFVVNFGLKQSNGRIIVLHHYDELDRTIQKHWVKFRMWNYVEELEWKDKSMKFNLQSRNFTIDINKLNEMKIRNLIKDWSFAQFNDKFKLLHAGGYLSDESYDMMKGFFPNIINAIINLMNEVLQNNG